MRKKEMCCEKQSRYKKELRKENKTMNELEIDEKNNNKVQKWR